MEYARRSERTHLSFLNHAQQFYLQRGCELRDLVEEEGAPVCFSYQAFSSRNGAGISAFRMPEQFRLKQVRRYGSAIDRYKRTLRTMAGVVQSLRHQFFARAALALNQHARIRRRNFLD